MKRIERLTAIITYLQSRKFTSMEKLQEKFDVSDRTLYRDIASLSEISVPIAFEKDKGYFILDRHFIPPISFTENEAISLALAGILMKRFSDNKTNEHFENALSKVKFALNSSQIITLEEMEDNIKTPTYNGIKSKDDNFLFSIQNAITRKQIIFIKYKNRKGEISERNIEPIGLTFYSNEWHTIAWCSLRKEYRDFIVSSIQELKNTGLAFQKEKHISLDEYILQLSEK